jgi:hypothetical protein
VTRSSTTLPKVPRRGSSGACDARHSCSNGPNIKQHQVSGTGSVDVIALKRGLRRPTLRIKYPIPSDAPINLLQYVKQELNNSLTLQVLYYKDIFATATDIISLLYKGVRFNKATLTCDIDGLLECEAELPAQDVEVTTAKIITQPTQIMLASYVEARAMSKLAAYRARELHHGNCRLKTHAKLYL